MRTSPHIPQLALGELHEMCTGKSLRLIFMGKVLVDGATLSASGIEDSSVMHAIASQPPPGAQPLLDSQGRLTGAAPAPTAPQPARTGPTAPPVDASQASGDAEQQALATGGFGRLRALGIDADGIGVLRASYYAGVQEVVAAMPRAQGESDAAHMARAEEEWMRQQGPFSEFAVNLRPLMAAAAAPRAPHQPHQGTEGVEGEEGDGTAAAPADAGHERFLQMIQSRRGGGAEEEDEGAPGSLEGTWADFFCGFMGGFFLGFVMVLCLFTGRFSRKARAGILAGAVANLVLQVTTDNPRSRTTGSGGSSAGGGEELPSGYPSLRGGGSQLVIH